MKSEKYVAIATWNTVAESKHYRAGNFLRDSNGSVKMFETVEEAEQAIARADTPNSWLVTNKIPECAIYEAMNEGVKMRPSTVTLHMTDEFTGRKVVRSIDITNVMSSGSTMWELRGKNEQRKNLEAWIEQRGNEQHNTILRLDSWEIS